MNSTWHRLGTAVLVVVVAVALTGCGKQAGDAAPEKTSDPGEAPEGMRYDYFRDVRVTVPTDWEYGSEPGSDWCVDEDSLPAAPYVSIGGSGVTLSIGCPATNQHAPGFSGEPPTEHWATHLSLVDAEPDTATQAADQVDGWWVLREIVGSVSVKAVSRDKEEAQRLVSSVVEVDRTAGGCTPRGSIQVGYFPRPDPAFDVSTLVDVDRIVVCQYTRLNDADAAGLEATATLHGRSADDVLAAIKASPEGGGPNSPRTCSDELPGDDAYELRLETPDQTHVMYVFYSVCHGNGFDDGVTRRALTAQACQPLMERPVMIWGGSSGSVELCWRPSGP